MMLSINATRTMQLLVWRSSLVLFVATLLGCHCPISVRCDDAAADKQYAEFLRGDVGLFEELCVTEYTLKKDLDTTEHREIVYELDKEYQDVMSRRIALGLRLNFYYCPSEVWDEIKLDESNRRSVQLMDKWRAAGGQESKPKDPIGTITLDGQAPKLGPQVVERTDRRLEFFDKLCELEYESKRRADVARGFKFNQYWKLYTKATNTRISLGHSLNIPHCPRNAWSGRKLDMKGAHKMETDCMRAQRAKAMCARLTKAVHEDHYDVFPEAVHLMNSWCEVERLFRVQNGQWFHRASCDKVSGHIQAEAKAMAADWLLLVEAEEVATQAEKEKGTYVGEPLRVLNRQSEAEADLEDDFGLRKKKSKLFSWFTNKNKENKSN